VTGKTSGKVAVPVATDGTTLHLVLSIDGRIAERTLCGIGREHLPRLVEAQTGSWRHRRLQTCQKCLEADFSRLFTRKDFCKDTG
jgi:hypothetical protein